MIVEWQRFRVRPELRQRFLELDAAVWTAGLAHEAGFLGKEVWLDPEEPGGVILAIRWESEAAWKAVARERLEALERQLLERLPESLGVERLEVRGFEVWQPPEGDAPA